MTDILGASDPFFSKLTNNDLTASRIKDAMAAKKMKDTEDAANNFEAMFIGEMLRPMFETVETDEVFGGGQSEDTWRSMLVEEYGKQIVKSGGIGLSDDIKAKMIEMQAAASASGSGVAELPTTTPTVPTLQEMTE